MNIQCKTLKSFKMSTLIIFNILFSFYVSFMFCLVFVKFNIASDIIRGLQKIHAKPVPRIGGLAIFLAFTFVVLLHFLLKETFVHELFALFLSSIPVFLFGFAEDISGKIPPKWRLLGGFVSALLAYFLLSAKVSRVDIPILDYVLSNPLFSFVFTTFAITGVSHAFNIIDGINGLASGVSLIVFASYAYVAYLLQDLFLLYVSLILFFATLGFFIWNYPEGRIFLGDGGAYFLGFMSATIGILLVNRCPEVSPWFPLLLVIYPVWETLFSIYRRKIVKEQPPQEADAFHLHQLVYKRIYNQKNLGALERNSSTASFFWILELMCAVPAILFWNNTLLLIVFAILFIVVYTWIYSSIVKFKTPIWLRRFTYIKWRKI